MKFFYKIIINIIIILLIYILFKFVSLVVLVRRDSPVLKDAITYARQLLFQGNYKKLYKEHNFVPPVIPDTSNKKPIIIFGCSYAEGRSIKPLEYEEKFSYRLYQATNRPVYNRAFESQGLQYMLYQLEDENFYKEIPEPEYIVYVYIKDHQRRLYQECCPWNKSLFYKENHSGQLVRVKNPLVYTYPFALCRIMKKINYKNYNFLKKHFIYAKSLSDKHWKNTKWIILLYDEKNTDNFEELKKHGFEIVLASDLTQEDFLTDIKYRISEHDPHPTKEAWELLTPLFADKYIK